MPVYTFRCDSCDAAHDVRVDLATADQLELICVVCGGDMRRAPVTTLNLIGPAIKARKLDKRREEHAYFAKACGHQYACRCGVKLNTKNPFSEDIRKAHGFIDDT